MTVASRRDKAGPPGFDESGKRRRRSLLLPVLVSLLMIAWVLNASQAGGTVEGCPDACSVAADPPHAGIRVVSLNMLHGFPRFQRLDQRIDIISSEVLRLDADIVCLQEVPWRLGRGTAANQLADRLGWNHVYARANGNRWTILFEEGEAILSRYPLREATLVELSPQAGFFEHRIALRAVARSPRGDLAVVVSHLTNGDPGANGGQADSLARFVERWGSTVPTVVAGDFNATEEAKQIQALEWLDTYRVSHADDPGWTCCVDDLGAGPEEALEKRIDYLFLVSGSAGVGAVIDSQLAFAQPQRAGDEWLWASDHVGLMSVISLEGAAGH